MADHIPFVSSEADCQLVVRYYGDSRIMRVPLERFESLRHVLPHGVRRWVDAGVDGLHTPYSAPHAQQWKDYIRQFPGYLQIGDRDFQANYRSRDREQVEAFVFAVLEKCAALKPAAISVPQLPMMDGNDRNKINRALAAAAGQWKIQKGFPGKMILPAVFTNQRQLNNKTDRNPKRRLITACYKKSAANGLWAVDSSLADQIPQTPLRNRRFPALLAFHEEIAKDLPEDAITIAGPYWGMNLVLWARGLCRFPAISVGGGYQYHLSGSVLKRAVARLALPPLRRWARAGPRLRTWLNAVLQKISEDDPAYAEFANLSDRYEILSRPEASRDQVASFYKQWFDELQAVPPAGRALALYQMFSSAYALGRSKSLPKIGSEKAPADNPTRVAEYLMLSCL